VFEAQLSWSSASAVFKVVHGLGVVGGWPAVKSMPASLDEYLNSAPDLPGAGEAVNH
jgi:hypothetical protein